MQSPTTTKESLIEKAGTRRESEGGSILTCLGIEWGNKRKNLKGLFYKQKGCWRYGNESCRMTKRKEKNLKKESRWWPPDIFPRLKETVVFIKASITNTTDPFCSFIFLPSHRLQEESLQSAAKSLIEKDRKTGKIYMSEAIRLVSVTRCISACQEVITKASSKTGVWNERN